jgi:negative regulator of flagellin synthesis FlgM
VKIDSELASRLQALGGRLRRGDGVDHVKVAELRSAIAEGRLQIEPQVIASRLLESVGELLRSRPESF